MEATVKLDKFGRLLIPKRIRVSQGWEPGVEVHLQVNESTKVVELHPTTPRTMAWAEIDKDGWPIIKYPEGASLDYNVVEAIKEAREERADHLASL